MNTVNMMTGKITIELSPREECFTHKDEDGTFRSFPIDSMFAFATRYARMLPEISAICAPLPPQQTLDFIRKNMGIEQERLDRLVSPYLERPLVAIRWKCGNLTVIDGNHRLLKLHEMGIPEYRVYVFEYPFWEQFLINLSADENTLKKPSGMLERDRQTKSFQEGKTTT